ncbi:hypothetical protein [Mycolicibacterium septicum]|uniref:hypothetical protein n=1 Tax=Mycolicibacterium septicum TaxID=98668 RepID=UPI001AF32FD2|nr:hypothetical protein [Mycolicibacterium septicum]QRY51744.1 hypothetical protein JVX95_30960 [Mycolicibacterium septicum]
MTIVVGRTKPEAQALARKLGVPIKWAFGSFNPLSIVGIRADEILIDKSAEISDKMMATIEYSARKSKGVVRYV